MSSELIVFITSLFPWTFPLSKNITSLQKYYLSLQKHHLSLLKHYQKYIRHSILVMIFPFLFILLYFSILIPSHSIQTAFPFHSHITSPWGSPRFPYLWLTSLEADFFFYSCTASHCLTLPGTALWLILTPFHLEAVPPLYFPSVWLVMTWLLSFTRLPFSLPSMYKYLVG